jgi:hypothetical protein
LSSRVIERLPKFVFGDKNLEKLSR